MQAASLFRRVTREGSPTATSIRRLSLLSTHFPPDSTNSNQSKSSPNDGSTFGFAATISAMTAGLTATFFSTSTKHTKCDAAEKIALNPKDFVKFKLKEKQYVSHNTSLYRFEFDPEATLGLSVASCLISRAPIGEKGEDGKPKFVIRPYTPISQPDVKGHFDLVVKVYPQGKMSKHFDSLKPGDVLEVKGPIPKLPYTPNMKKTIGMIAGGTGITPMLQIIDAILRNPDDYTQVTLVFANNTPEDVLLKDRLDELQALHPNFKVFYVVAFPDGNWKGGVGHISKEIAKKSLPAPSSDTLILVCGPPGMMNFISGDKAKDKSQGELTGLLKDLGYSKDQVYKF